MYSKIVESRPGTAAWRISLWSSVAFALGTALTFMFLRNFLANDIQSRADSWLTGELGVLADVAQRTPENRLHDVVVREVAELASREVPHEDATRGAMDRSVFFIQTTSAGQLKLHTGASDGVAIATAITKRGAAITTPEDIGVPHFRVPFRVAASQLPNGDRIYLGLSTSYERRVLHRLRVDFAWLWCCMILFGALIVFISTRRMLHRVQMITDTTAAIGRENLSSRIPVTGRNDEISRLSLTLNTMLDRIESAVQQLHAMSDALAHDLRSPMTSVRGKLELALMSDQSSLREEAVAHSIEELDRISALLSTSLDVSEASADSLRLRKQEIDLSRTVSSIVELYEPAFAQAGLTLCLAGIDSMFVYADAALLQRTLANLLENELRHLPAGASVTVTLRRSQSGGVLLVEDDGAGFPKMLLPHLFERYSKGPASSGRGLGLAFVAAVIRSHEGMVSARNREQGGACITVELPILTMADRSSPARGIQHG